MNMNEEKLLEIFSNSPRKIVISKPSGKATEFTRIELELKKDSYLASKYTDKQVFHDNIAPTDAVLYCLGFLKTQFRQFNAWNESFEYMLMISKKGAVAYKARAIAKGNAPKTEEFHNRQKNYIIPEGVVIPPLIDMGIFSNEGKIINSMYDKFKQINRFIELVDDAIKNSSFEHLNIIDFGCGKSYLTFILYYYFTKIRKISINIVGLDLKKDVIDKCNESAKKYGYDNLHFELGDINGYKCNFDVDMVISLHACDTATDFALYNAIMWNAKMIFSVPCCQHELNKQIKGGSLLTRYGIVKERFSALATDAIRAGLLESCGYNTQLLEFVDFAHTPKNILIRAIKKNGKPNASAIKEVEELIEAYSFTPTLYSLLKKNENSCLFGH